eukprot:TRINITY_DN10813_c0_g1_i1.p2 TRINITY_DN10813_c0_g1~~TRINITY_DN10813_c0_g1_i1.p2  ORF type:complete len:145 (+),score=19.02 TRINITY_DN10813_c0_g1_i1:171-605(+)
MRISARPRAFTAGTTRTVLKSRAVVVARAELAPGAKVKVTSDLKVYHVPGFKSGIDLQGKEGEVVQNVTEYQGVELSPNYPWKVQFEVEKNGKMKSFFCHLDEDELQAAQSKSQGAALSRLCAAVPAYRGTLTRACGPLISRRH